MYQEFSQVNPTREVFNSRKYGQEPFKISFREILLNVPFWFERQSIHAYKQVTIMRRKMKLNPLLAGILTYEPGSSFCSCESLRSARSSHLQRFSITPSYNGLRSLQTPENILQQNKQCKCLKISHICTFLKLPFYS